MDNHYFKIDVLGSHGYSFMICTTETDKEAVIDLAAKNNIFADADDRECCLIDEADEDEVKHFKEWNCCYYDLN